MAGERYFEYYALYNPPNRRNSDGDDITPQSTVIVDVNRVLAKTEREVAMLVARELPASYTSQLDRVTVTIRPF